MFKPLITSVINTIQVVLITSDVINRNCHKLSLIKSDVINASYLILITSGVIKLASINNI